MSALISTTFAEQIVLYTELKTSIQIGPSGENHQYKIGKNIRCDFSRKDAEEFQCSMFMDSKSRLK